MIFPFEFLRVKEGGPAQGWGRVQKMELGPVLQTVYVGTGTHLLTGADY